ncbi:MAG: hypothetical protein ACI4V5_06685 [Prevotella sp.]
MIVLCLVVSANIGAQTTRGNAILRQFEQNFLMLDSLILGSNTGNNANIPSIPIIISGNIHNKYNSEISSCDSALAARSTEKLKELSGATGLKFTGQTYYRLDEGLGFDDDDALSGYKGKLQAEVRWDFFKSALYNRKGKAEIVAIEEQIDKLKYRKEDATIRNIGRKNLIQERYDNALASVLLHHIDNLSMLCNAQEYLLSNENISSDMLLGILNEKAECERMLATLDNDASTWQYATDLSAPQNSTIKVDTTTLLAAIRQYSFDAKEIDLKMKMLERQACNSKYWNDATISPFMRYSLYLRSELPNSSNLDAGVAFTLPLSTDAQRHKKTLQAERDLLEIEKRHVNDKVEMQVKLIVNEIERMNRAAEGELKRLKELKQYIAMRVNAYNHRRGGYNLMARAKEYNNYFACWEKLLAYQYKRNCLIADLQLFLDKAQINRFLTVK